MKLNLKEPEQHLRCKLCNTIMEGIRSYEARQICENCEEYDDDLSA